MVLGNLRFEMRALIVMTLMQFAVWSTDSTNSPFYYGGNGTKVDYNMGCTQHGNGSQMVNCTAFAYESDPDFAYKLDNGTLVTFNCWSMNVTAYWQTSKRQSLCPLGRVDSNSTVNASDPATRLMSIKVNDIDLTSSEEQECGVVVQNGTVHMVVMCLEHEHLNQKYDTLVVLATSDFLDTKLDANVEVKIDTPTKVDREVSTTFKVYRTTTRDYPDAEITVPDDTAFIDIEGQTTSLGDVAYAELCVLLPDSSGISSYFYVNENAPVVGRLSNCHMTYIYAQAQAAPDFLTLLNSEGCTVPVNHPILHGIPTLTSFNGYEYGVTYAWNQNYSLEFNQQTAPNCVRSPLFGIVVPAKLFGGPKVTPNKVHVNLTCDVTWCFYFDQQCYYYPGSPIVPEPNCSMDALRKKRSDVDDVDDYSTPETFMTSFSINLGVADEDIITEPRKAEPKECFEKKTFFAVTIALGILLLIVFAIALVLFVKIRNDDFDRGSSAKGFHNKAYN